MPTVTIQQAQNHLPDLIHQLKPGDEVVITENQRPIARLSAAVQERATGKPRQPGTLRGTVLYMAPDFNAPLEDFREYLE
jgi:antitoxin (DNA-binding transcriptional repressor) of toxin-antitoxin stability system